MKGRLALTFWLVVVLAVVTSTASYAWLAINTMARLGGFEVELESDSLYLEISKDAREDYGTEVSFDGTMLYAVDDSTHEILLVSYGEVPSVGAILLYPTQLNADNAHLHGAPDGTYDGGENRFYLPAKSDISGGKDNFIDVTDTLSIGESLIGYYAVGESSVAYPTATASDRLYYVKTARGDGNVDYSCIGKFEIGETLAGRKYWGYANSTNEEKSDPNNIMNVVSMDTPTEEYSLKRTVFLRGATGTADAKDLKISSVKIGGRKNYLTSAVRIMFVATSDRGRSTAVIYNHRNPGSFDGTLFEEIFGDERETVTVDMYIYFDGKDEAAHNSTDFLTSHTVSVHFTVDDHVYNQ